MSPRLLNLPVFSTSSTTQISGGTVSVSPTGALDGDGSVGDPLAVLVDGVTVTIVGDHLVAPSGGGGTIGGTVGTTDNAVPRADGSGGSTLQGSVVLIADTTGVISGTKGVTISGSSSGATAVVATAAAGSTTLTLPAATDTLVGKATTDALTNKTYDTVGTGNVFKINGAQVSSIGTGLSIAGGVLTGTGGTGSQLTVLTSDPTPADDILWCVRSGTAPGDSITIKVQVNGTIYELAGVTQS